MKRFEAIKTVAGAVKDEIVVSNIGDPSKELFAAGDRKENFYMLGSMGMASSIGLGMALANKRDVIVLDGDGAVTMNLGTLVTIAKEAPDNLKLVILDNGAYGSTGYQRTALSSTTGASIGAIASACGNERVKTVSDAASLEAELKSAITSGKGVIIVAKVDTAHEKFPFIRDKGAAIKERFMASVSNTTRGLYGKKS